MCYIQKYMPRNDKIYTDVGNSFDLIKDGQLDE